MPDELLELIVQTLLQTAERVAQGLPIDAHHSIMKAQRDVKKEASKRELAAK